LAPRNPRPELRDKRKREILEAAAAVFAERGFRTARIADIADRAGIGKGTVYEYFRSKEDLFISLFDWYLNQIFASVSNELDISSKSIVDALTRSSEILLISCDRMRPFYPLTMEFWAASSAPAFKERLAEEFKLLSGSSGRDHSVGDQARRTWVSRESGSIGRCPGQCLRRPVSASVVRPELRSGRIGTAFFCDCSKRHDAGETTRNPSRR
jgi:AcrR family transcriptional regulator